MYKRNSGWKGFIESQKASRPLYKNGAVTIRLNIKDLNTGVYIKTKDTNRPASTDNLIIRPMNLDSFRMTGGNELVKICPVCNKTFTVKWWDYKRIVYCSDQCKNRGKKDQATLHWK